MATIRHAGPADASGIAALWNPRLAAAAAARGGRALIAAISGENPGAMAFHARCGFAEVGRIPEAGRKLGRRLDLVLMQRHL